MFYLKNGLFHFQVLTSIIDYVIVQQIPQHIIKTGCLSGRTSIELYDCETDDKYMCELHTSKRKYSVEQFLGKGWYAYARDKGLTKGVMLEFSIQNLPVTRIVVSVLKR